MFFNYFFCAYECLFVLPDVLGRTKMQIKNEHFFVFCVQWKTSKKVWELKKKKFINKLKITKNKLQTTQIKKNSNGNLSLFTVCLLFICAHTRLSSLVQLLTLKSKKNLFCLITFIFSLNFSCKFQIWGFQNIIYFFIWYLFSWMNVLVHIIICN